MANTVNKHLNIYVNGKEVENTIKSIDGALGYLRNKIRSLENGSPEQQALIEQYRQLKKISDDNKEALHGMNKEMESTSSELENMTDKTKKWFTAAAVFGVGKIVVDTVGKIKSSISEYVEAFATLDDAMAAVRKTTGMTTEEVDQLKESLKNMDTRTATNELLKIAEQGGRLGIAKEDIESFTKAVDVANVALGDSFGGGAEEIATVLGKIRNAYKETNTGEIGDSFNRIGSVINELGATSAASEQNIAEFTRRVGAMPEVFKPSIQEAMALGAAFEENSVDAEIASRSYGVFMKTASADISKFAQAMGEPVDAMRELINTNPTAFALKFSETLKGLNATQTGEYLKNLGLNADGVSKVLGALSNNTDRVREMIQTAITAFSEGTSIMNEFNVVNENTAAQLEKAKKAAADATAELGEKLAPVLITITNGTAGFMKVLGSVAKVLLDNKAIVLAAAAAYATLYAIKSKNIIMDKAHSVVIKLKTIALSQQEAVKLKSIARTAQKIAMDKKAILTTEQETLALMKKRMETLKGIAADNQMKAIMAQEIVVKNAATLATRKQAQAARMAAEATKAQKAAFASTPWGAIIMAVTAIAAGIYKLATRTTAAEKAMKEFNKESAKEEAQARTLFSALKNTEKGTDDYKRILEKLKELYPDIIQAHLDESGALNNIDAAYKEVISSIRTKIAMQTKEEAITETMSEVIERQKKGYDAFRKTLIKGGASMEIANTISDELSKVIDNGENIYDYIDNLKKRYEGINFNYTGWFEGSFRTLFQLASSIHYIGYRAEKEIQSIEQSFSPFIKEVSSGVDEITIKINELYDQLSFSDDPAEKKSIQKQINEYKKQLLEEKTESGKGTGGDSDCTGDPKTCQCSECKNKRKEDWVKTKMEFDKELKKFEAQNRLNQMGEWEKTKEQIETQYDEMIDKAIKFYGKESKIAKDLESKKGDAVIKAGQEYLKKYADVLKKFEDETKKLAAKTDLSPEQSQMATEILGSQQEWDDKIAELQTNIETIGDMVQDMDFDDENYAYFSDMLSKMIDAQCVAIRQKGEATANIIQDYVRQSNEFVVQEEKSLSESQMSEYDKQISAIDDRYDAEIKKVEETIKAKERLMAEGGDSESIQAEIEELKKTITQMNGLRVQAKSAVRRDNVSKLSSGNVWDRVTEMMKMTPEEFAENWKAGIITVADAMQELADTAFSVFDSISQVMHNKNEAELKEYTELQEAKSGALQKQYDQGVVSEKYYNAQMEKIQEEQDKKEKAIQHEEFEREKKASIVKAVIYGLLASILAFAQLGPIAGAVASALVLVATAAQIAAIATQVNPYATGGWIKGKQLILAGEEGEEWVASNKLLKDKKSKHVIEALEAYRQGNGSALDNVLKVPVPSPKKLSQSANSISRTFADNKSQVVNNNYYPSENGSSAMLKEIRQMNKYLSDPKNRQAFITRKQQLEFEQQENDIKKYARL